MTAPLTASLHTPHGFFTRQGGVSEGIFSSLNCGYGSNDVRAHVQENRARVAAHFGLPERQLITLYQVHSPLCVSVSAPFENTPPEADALATNTPGLILGILTADCAPVLLEDAKNRVIGAAHAGWKGAHGGALESTVAAMEKLGAVRAHIRAAVGPCIGQSSYEVGPEFVERIDDTSFFTPGQGDRSQFDLRAYVAARLHACGIAQMETLPNDTCAEESRFFSFRRATLRAEGSYGRQISCIALK